jgi:acyl transferase domain-containing protein/acyl carrier protein
MDHSAGLPRAKNEPIAVVGIGCRFPGGVDSPESYWELLSAGRDALIDIPRERWEVEKFYDPDLASGTSRVRRGGFLNCPIDEFDAAFFGISPREADHIDPQQRLLLEVAWEALENAGAPLERLAGSDTGVFIGGFTLDYGQLQFAGVDRSNVAAHTATGVVMTMLANRISHAFDFTGPSLALDTACSSSLVAVHLACHSLWSGESGTALAGGVNLMLTPNFTIAASQGGFLSPTSHSRAFDARADGYVRGEGAGVVVLKRLADALRDGDQVHAVIRGTAVSQDGHTNGITVPNGESQQIAMRHALAEAGVAARSVGYVEAHGTGTPVGDPIEANAIGAVYGAGSGRRPDDPCLIASVKTNIGHLEAAAGAAALIKVVLCLQHRQVPPHLHLTTLNPAIDLTALRLRIPAVSEHITEHEGVVRAAVNSFGFGGTNAHAVLESAPVPVSAEAVVAARGPRPADPLPAIFPVSARSAEALAQLADRYAEALHSPEQVSVLASATAHRRTHHRQARLAVVTDDPLELREGLACVGAGQPHPAVHVSAGPAAAGTAGGSPLAFVYTGMGPQWWGMGRDLLTRSPVFRAAIERCDAELRRLADWSLTEELLAAEESSRMGATAISQPANFALQVALTELWASLGIRPDAIIGHSAGEIAAAYVAGALTFEDAVTVIFHRARLQHQTTGQGRLVAAAITPERALELPPVVAGRVEIAAVNSPVSVALVGQVPDLEEVKAMLDGEDVFCRFVDGAVPFHSPLMDPLEPELRECLAGLTPRAPVIPLYSTVTGCRVTAATHDASYWWGNVRDPVRFRDGALAMIDDGITAFVEVGPHPVLNRSVADCLSARKRHGVAVPSLKRGAEDAATMAHACADLYVAGYAPDWTAFYPGRSFQRLPAYPWQRERYWKEADATRRDRLGELEHTFLGTGGDLPLPTWRRYLDGSRPAYLADHRVMDSNLFPGAGYVEMALAAGRSLFGAPHCVAERVRFEAPVIIRPGSGYMLDTTVDKTTGRVAIYGRRPDSRHWVRHASARLAPAAVTRPVFDLDAIRARCGARQDGSQFYEAVRGHGFDYGPAFRPIAGLWLGEREALGEFRSDALAPSADDDLVLDPVALDGCFQMLLPLISSAVEEHAALLPVGVDRIIVHDRPVGPLWVHASAARTVGSNLVGDAVLVTADGRAVIEVRGFHARIVGAEQQARPRLGNRWLHEVTWQAAELAAGESTPPGRWLLLADRHGVADRIASELTAAGHAVVVARPGAAFAIAGDDEFVIRPEKRQDIGKVVRDLAERADKPIRGVVYFSPADLDSETTGMPDTVAAGVKPLLHLVQTLDTVGLAWPLTVVTTGAQPACAKPADCRVDRTGLGQAPLWGIGRVLHQESLALRSRLLDLDPERPLADVTALVNELLQAEPEEDQVAWRGGERLVARLQPSRRDSGSVPVSLRADASYLVTGGLGSLGLLYAKWLAEHGARRVVLLSRSQLPPRSEWDELPHDHARQPAIRAIRSIEELGAIVEIISLDVADPAGLAALVEQRHAAHLPPVRGIIHSAGAVQDQVMVKMTDEQLEHVLRPKVGGAWALHEAFATQPLDFFVLFSSVSSVLVTAGQGNYAAGNAFLDGLAHYRRARGLPALSINWGPWDAGMIAQLQLQPFYQRRGLDLIPEETGAEIFAELVGSSEIEQVVVSADWPTLVASYPIVPRLIEHLAQAHEHTAADDADGAVSVAERLAAASPADHPRVVADCCAEIIGGVLRIRADNLDREMPLNQLGLDSMIAVELRIRLEQAFGVAPKMVFLLQGTTVAGVAAYLEEKLVPPPGDTQTADLADLLADLSPEAAEELLAQVTRPTTKGSDQ